MKSSVISTEKQGNAWIMAVTINLTGTYYSVIKMDLKSAYGLIDEDPDWEELIMDMSQCNHVDSSGIGIIASLYKRSHKKKKIFRVIHCNELLSQTFKACGLYEVLNVNKSLDQEESYSEKDRLFIVKKKGKAWFFYPHTDLVISNVARLKEELTEVFGKELNKDLQWEAIIFDLKEIHRIDSASIGVLLGIYRRTHKAGKDFLIEGCNQDIYQMLEMTGICKLFTVST